MELQIIPRQNTVPEFDPHTIAVQYIEYDHSYSGDQITETLIAKILKQIPSGIETILYLDPDGEDNWLEVLCDGEWLALRRFWTEQLLFLQPRLCWRNREDPTAERGTVPH